MERAVNVVGCCGEARRIRPDHPRRHPGAWAVVAIAIPAGLAVISSTGLSAVGQTTSSSSTPDKAIQGPGPQGANRPAAATVATSKLKAEESPPQPPGPPLVDAAKPPRFKVRDEFGQCVVARLHGQYGGTTALILPDGQTALIPQSGQPGALTPLVPTSEPFKPLTASELRSILHNGPFVDYQLLTTDHYLIFYKSTPSFAQDSGRLLEDLYRGLIDTFRRKDVPVHESEFPLVAVIFATEQDFRAHKRVDPQVRAYYEFFTNRIFFYQKSDRDHLEPRVAALLKPQTVAHEGAHQILSNIGVQPRPNSWPPWLVEGLAEYCATTVNTKKGIMWSGLGAINSLHMATIRELEDPLSNQMNTSATSTKKVARKLSISQSEALLLKQSLTPTDYAEAWALTHYLAQKRPTEFFNYVKAMSQVPPLEPRTPEENLLEFRRFFNEAPGRLDKKLGDHIHYMSRKNTYVTLYYYQVVFQQALGNGVVRRAATVSQSPQIIQQWVQEMTSSMGDIPTWEVIAWPTRARAEQAAQEWMRGF
jgi:Protein of unknown function (DUF1570)